MYVCMYVCMKGVENLSYKSNFEWKSNLNLLLFLDLKMVCITLFTCSLQPYVDCETGALVSWPAYSTKQPLVKLSASEHDRIETPKPKFLDRLEKFLSKELRALDCTDPSKPSEKRLQVGIAKAMQVLHYTSYFNVCLATY